MIFDFFMLFMLIIFNEMCFLFPCEALSFEVFCLPLQANF